MQKIEIVKVSALVPDEHQPRKYFAADKINSLAASIKKIGVKTPLTVEDFGQGKYLIVHGERRYRAVTQLGLKEVPVIVEKPKSSIERLIEQFNVQEQHEAWTPTEKAVAIETLAKEMKQDIGKLCALLNIPERMASTYLAYATLRDKNKFLRSETPLHYAERIQSLKVVARKAVTEDLEETFDGPAEKALEHAVIDRIKDGTIKNASDLSKVKDSFMKDAKTVKKFIETSATPDELFIGSKAKGARALRRLTINAGYMTSYAKEYLRFRDVQPTVSTMTTVRTAHAALGKFLKEIGDDYATAE